MKTHRKILGREVDFCTQTFQMMLRKELSNQTMPLIRDRKGRKVALMILLSEAVVFPGLKKENSTTVTWANP